VDVVVQAPNGRRYRQTFVRGDSSVGQVPRHETLDEGLPVDVDLGAAADVLMFALPDEDEPLDPECEQTLDEYAFSRTGQLIPLRSDPPQIQARTAPDFDAPAYDPPTEEGINPAEPRLAEPTHAPSPSDDLGEETSPQVPPMVGELGRYVPVGRIGASTDTEVLLAYAVDTADEMFPVAVRRLIPRDGGDWSGRCARLAADGRVGVSLRHEHLVSVTDFGTDEGAPFVVRELIDGVNIRAINATPDLHITARVAATIGWQVARALEFVHTKLDSSGAPMGLAHQEICPTAIFIRTDGVVKLTEVGVTRVPGLGPLTSHNGGRRGLMGYAAPEQMRGQPLDSRGDLFSLGVVLIEVLTRQPLLINGDLPFEHLEQAVMQRCAGVQPAGLVALLRGLVSLEPTRRPKTTRAVVRGFELALAELGGPCDLAQELAPIFAAKGLRRPSSAPPPNPRRQSALPPPSDSVDVAPVAPVYVQLTVTQWRLVVASIVCLTCAVGIMMMLMLR